MTQPSQPASAANPFFRSWTTPFGIAPFGEIAIADYRPAFDRALAEHRVEIEAIATSSALVDMAFHSLEDAAGLDPIAFEREELTRIGMPEGMVMRHRTPHFAHVFAGDGYSAGYYSYMWSEVLDADGFAAFEEKGDVFDEALAQRLGDFVYSAGNLRDPLEAYIAFRGREPDPQALLVKRGLAKAA